MSKLIKFEVKKFPAVRLIGKAVQISLNAEGNAAAANLWGSMWQDGSMELLQNMTGRYTKEKDTVGWRGDYDTLSDTCSYIAGVLAIAGTPVPAGYVSKDLPECFMSIGWIQGLEEQGDLYAKANEHVMEQMKEYGYEIDKSAGDYQMEYYSFYRFGAPRYLGERVLIMDYYCPCKKLLSVRESNRKDTEINDRKEKDENEFVIDLSKIRKNFDNLAQRIIYAYQCTYPICLPISDERASERSQRHMHEFLQDTINIIYHNTAVLNFQDEKDDFYEVWMLNNSNPELDDKMRKTEKVLLDFYAYLSKLGECGDVIGNRLYISKDKMKFVKKRIQQLEEFGLTVDSDASSTIFYCEKYPDLFPAWKLLSDKKPVSDKRQTTRGEIAKFIYCMYDPSLYKGEHLYGNIIEDSTCINELEVFLANKGYDSYFDESGIRWEKEYKDKQKGYGSFSFQWRKRDQMTISIRVPNFRIALTHFNEMKDTLKGLSFSRTKNCDGCGYCTQLDKTGKRVPLTMELEYHGIKLGKCPIFPNLTWRNIDRVDVERIKELFEFTEKY